MKRLFGSLCALTFLTTGALAHDLKSQSNRGVEHTTATHVSDTSATETANENACTKVWVNTQTHVYHVPGSFWYGATSHGRYMCEGDAVRTGNTRGSF
ncbi:hypothetical protein AA0472_0423 [Acetobacter estunensis NRIC 0472]|uniref:Uncharacterized protein n=1 Tax=Acetobacter estunensis TaxID=104097 RepID=A0A967EI15_9PROT|nr:hypothetical protein [Acetobacter estunensis]NHO54697.1 hypothetical protein [Acetobacter estunensis]GBQ21352.1 hypothetical protein AA0472_0423 [Acetobacter estunensis NRIC 0472]